jgi:hypothetical protein
MKIFSKFFDLKTFEHSLKDYNHIDFSLFIDELPKTNTDLSQINIVVLAEPNEYFGIHDWVIENKNLFSIILTWNDRILNTCDNALFFPFGQTWFTKEQYEKDHIKEFNIAHLCGVLLKSYGHQMRHEILARENEFKVPTNFYKTIGDRHNENDARVGKETVFSNSQFGIAIENFSHRGYFSEKILDCFLMKTIPIYNGCSNIDEFFNKKGIITFNNVDDLIYLSNQLTPEYYSLHKNIVEDNYQRSLQYVNYTQSISDKIIEIFKINEL